MSTVKAWKTPSDDSPPGPLPWELEDGTTPESARRDIIAYLEFTHDPEECCAILHIGIHALEEIKRTPLAVSRDVGRRCARLRRVLYRNPARYFECIEKVKAEDAARKKRGRPRKVESTYPTPPPLRRPPSEPDPNTARGLNTLAAREMGRLIKEARLSRGLTTSQVGKQMRIGTQAAYDMERGLSPRSQFFFRACEFFNINPEELNFAGYCLREIREWRKKTTHAEK